MGVILQRELEQTTAPHVPYMQRSLALFLLVRFRFHFVFVRFCFPFVWRVFVRFCFPFVVRRVSWSGCSMVELSGCFVQVAVINAG